MTNRHHQKVAACAEATANSGKSEKDRLLDNLLSSIGSSFALLYCITHTFQCNLIFLHQRPEVF